MKSLVLAAFIAVCSAGRLEHLEQQPNLRGYLPPSQRSNFGQGFGGHGGLSVHGIHGAHGGHDAFGASSGTFGGAQGGYSGFNSHASFPSPSNQYLPSNHGFSSSRLDDSDSVAIQGFGALSRHNQQFGHQGLSQYHGANRFSAQGRFQHQSSAVSRQYLAPHSSQNLLQQPFNERTGYQY